MLEKLSYRDYVSNAIVMKEYSEYQKRYAINIRESDRRLIDLIRYILENQFVGREKIQLLDVGCSTGNLLLHIKRRVPDIELVGVDLVEDILDKCRKSFHLKNVKFEQRDVLELGYDEDFDIVTASAMLCLLNGEEFQDAIENISKALKVDGWFLAFDWLHPFEQELTIIEKTQTHREGLLFHFRPYSKVREILEKNHFSNITFQRFEIPIDLPRPPSSEDMTTYTVRSDRGHRMNFRGILFQPWCHLMARKVP